MDHAAPPVLVVVTGPPAAGKTTLSRALAPRLGLPLIAKDTIKEALMDRHGAGDRASSQQVGAAAFDVMYALAREFLAGAQSVMLEAPMNPELASPMLQDILNDTRALAVRIHLAVSESIARERYRRRAGTPGRHPGHLDAVVLDAWAASPPRTFAPLDLPGPLIEIDTNDFAMVDVDALVTRVRAAIEAKRTAGRAEIHAPSD